MHDARDVSSHCAESAVLRGCHLQKQGPQMLRATRYQNRDCSRVQGHIAVACTQYVRLRISESLNLRISESQNLRISGGGGGPPFPLKERKRESLPMQFHRGEGGPPPPPSGDSEIQRFRDSEIQRCGDSEIQRFRDSEIRRFRESIISLRHCSR